MTEYRNYKVSELRAEKTDKGYKIGGYAACFNSPSLDLGGFIETINPGAFADSLKANDIRCLLQHDSDKPLARTSAGTLTLNEDKTGLAFSAELPDTSYANDLIASINHGDIDAMSFGFNVPKGGDNWTVDANNNNVRTLSIINLSEVSPVTYPAYPSTSVSMRSLPTDKLNKALIRAEHGLTLTTEDRATINEAMETLTKAMPVEKREEKNLVVKLEAKEESKAIEKIEEVKKDNQDNNLNDYLLRLLVLQSQV